MNREEMDELIARSYRVPGLDHGAEANYCATELVKIFRGQNRWPDFALHALEKAGDVFDPALLIYDADFYESDGTKEKLNEATQRLKHNLQAMFNYCFPRFSLRYLSPSFRQHRHKVKVAMGVMTEVTKEAYTKRDWEANAFANRI